MLRTFQMTLVFDTTIACGVYMNKRKSQIADMTFEPKVIIKGVRALRGYFGPL